jgi:hypothetical protein
MMNNIWSKVYFLHYREYNNYAATLGKLSSTGGATVAYRYVHRDNGLTYVQYTIAKCSKREHFNKRIGRLIAGGRLTCERLLPDQRIFQTDNWFLQFQSAMTAMLNSNNSSTIHRHYGKSRKPLDDTPLVTTQQIVHDVSGFPWQPKRSATLWEVLFG